MTILEALKNYHKYNLRIEYERNKWLLFDGDNWCVYEHPYRAKVSKLLIETQDEEKAVEMLLRE